MSDPKSLDELRGRFNSGERFQFLHFWGHTPPPDGTVSPSCFSQWFPAPFIANKQRYPTAEHFMMAAKARLFRDDKTLEKILTADTPAAAKTWGRKVAGFSEALWLRQRYTIVCEANLAKFQQHPELGEYLIRTAGKVLVEASPVDAIWGIGLAESNPGANDPNQWRGLNLLGFALMETRLELLAHGA